MSDFTCIKTIDFPCECQYLNATTHLNSNFIFDDHTYYKYIIIGILGVFFVSVLIYFFQLRNEVSFKARSPKLIALGVILIALDSLGNVMIYSGTSDVTHWNRSCNV